MGGYGSAVLELFNEKRITTPVIQVGWPDQFIEHASTVEDLRQKYGLTVEKHRRAGPRRIRPGSGRRPDGGSATALIERRHAGFQAGCPWEARSSGLVEQA